MIQGCLSGWVLGLWKLCDLVRKVAETILFCLIGVPTAGTALAAACFAAEVSDTNTAFKPKTSFRIMREVKKEHGRDRGWVVGAPDHQKHHYVLVDNVATSGESIERAALKLVEDGFDVSQVDCLILVDRQQGAVKRLQRVGFRRIVVVFNLLDIAYAFGELKIWPQEAVQKVKEEIKAHQFV